MYLLGYGHWGQRIHAALARLGQTCEIIDITQGRSIRDITEPGAVMVVTPTHLHHQHCAALLDRGYDVYVEKPACVRLQEIQDLTTRVKGDQIFMVGHLFQYHPQRDQIHTLLAAGFLGPVHHITSRRLNWGIYQPASNPVLNIGIHDITIVNDFLGGRPAVNWAQAISTLGHNTMDRVIWTGNLRDATFDCEVSWGWPQRVRETVLLCERGQIVWNQDRNDITITRHTVTNGRCRLDTSAETITYASELSPLEHEVQHWLHCVQNRVQPRTGLAQAKDAAYVAEHVLDLI
jgi:predicted dehydrogenase